MVEDNLRASDGDREKIVEQLRLAMNEGRLTVHEFDDRLQKVYAARTYGELSPVLADLPVPKELRAIKKNAPALSVAAVPQWVIIMWIPWVAINALLLTIWVATGAGYFWPFWAAAPTAAALLIPTGIGVLIHKPKQ
ncbi:DUF1707 domain-containing protein [Nocardia panacis]|uniref:DUF1707 domain-containing protein n=1 Tax=Nocardia panacis TaxID=2340916 RepID=A0A3A4KL04_9NOCA|nr:DUF1707 domain-containing protein [Nocardia panacis]RJO69949.1 DUF1707 domain-containing protein [Nocardia panacis]